MSNFTFSRAGGFNIINVNPSTCDMLLVEKEIINITKAVVTTIKKAVGLGESVNHFIEEKI